MSEFTDEIKDIFSHSGLLSGLEGFEFRQQQQQMAVSIADSLESNVNILVMVYVERFTLPISMIAYQRHRPANSGHWAKPVSVCMRASKQVTLMAITKRLMAIENQIGMRKLPKLQGLRESE